MTLSTTTKSTDAARVMEFLVTPQLAISSFFCTSDLALAVETAAEDCLAANDPCLVSDLSTLGFTFSECSSDIGNNDSILIRGGLFALGDDVAAVSDVTDTCLASTLSSPFCTLYFSTAIDNLDSVTVQVADEATPPPVKLTDTKSPTFAPKITLPRTIAPIAPTLDPATVSSPPITSPTVTQVVAPSLAPSALTINLRPTVAPAPSQMTLFPSHSPEPSAAPRTRAPMGNANITSSTNATTTSNNGVIAPIVTDPSSLPSNNRAVANGDDNVAYKGIVGAFAGVLGLLGVAYAGLVWKRNQRNKDAAAAPTKASALMNDDAAASDNGLKGTTLVLGAIPLDPTQTTLSEHDDLDQLEHGGNRSMERFLAVASPNTARIREHFGGDPHTSRPVVANSATRRSTVGSRSSTGGEGSESIPDNDELSSTCSSFDLNDSDGEESSMYESDGGDETSTLEEGGLEQTWEGVGGGVGGPNRSHRQSSSAQLGGPRSSSRTASEASSKQSSQLDTTGAVGTDESTEPETERPAAASRQFMEWLHKSPLIPAAAKASQNTTVDPPVSPASPSRQSVPPAPPMPTTTTTALSAATGTASPRRTPSADRLPAKTSSNRGK
jgi:hypothetical protein